MKRLLKVFILLLSSFVFLYSSQNAYAQANAKNIQPVVLTKDQIVNSDYVAKGSIVDIAGTINGDAYIAGGNIAIEGTINGDLLAAGGIINIKGNVNGNVRVIGGNITVTGIVDRNFSSLGGSVNIADGAKIGGSVTGAGGMFTFFGPVGKDIRIAGGQLMLGNTIGGNVSAYTGQMSISSNANIAGDVAYWSNQKAEVASGAAILGKITQNTLPQNDFFKGRPANFVPMIKTFVLFGKTVDFLASFIAGLIFIISIPVYFQKEIATTKKYFWKNVGVGIFTAIVSPILIILLFISVIGIPLGIFGGMFFAFLIYAARIIAAMVIGEWIIRYFSKNTHLVWSLLAGLIIYEILSFIPILGWIFSAIFIAAGLGAIITEKKHSYTQLRAKKLI